MTDSVQRLTQKIEEAATHLDKWQEKRLYAENPSEKKRCELEIRDLENIIHGYKTELFKYLDLFTTLMKDDNAIIEPGTEYYDLFFDIACSVKSDLEKLKRKGPVSEAALTSFKDLMVIFDKPEGKTTPLLKKGFKDLLMKIPTIIAEGIATPWILEALKHITGI